MSAMHPLVGEGKTLFDEHDKNMEAKNELKQLALATFYFFSVMLKRGNTHSIFFFFFHI